MSKHIIISSDSTCDLSQDLIDRYQIRILPMGVSLGDKIYRDGVDITPDDIYAAPREDRAASQDLCYQCG